MPHVNPTRQQAQDLAALPDATPVVMLNLLKFNKLDKQATEKYKNYMKAAYPFFVASGAEILYHGKVVHTFIGNESEAEWDEMLLVKYKQKSDFIGMTTAQGYPHNLRAEALEDSRLFVCQ